jgi:hypothetical protein
MTQLEIMLQTAPVVLYVRNGQYQCNWSPRPEIHGRASGPDPMVALYRAYKDAQNQGWFG